MAKRSKMFTLTEEIGIASADCFKGDYLSLWFIIAVAFYSTTVY
jgi:hypothetical protein